MVASLAQAVEDGHRAGRQFSGWSPSRIQVRDGGVDLSALEGVRQQEDLAYTAPETADGGAHTPRSDVYSAGVILYEILAGSHPFGGLSVKQPRGAPKPLGDARRDLPKDLADAVTACLERDPEWRPADLSYVLRVSQEAAATAGVKPAARPAAPAPTARTPAATGRMAAAGRRDPMPSLGGRSGAAPSSSRLPLLLVVLVLVLGGGAAAYFFLLGGAGGGGTAPPAPTRVAAARTATPTPETEATAATPEPVTPRPAATLPSTGDKPLARTATATATAVPTIETPTAPPLRTATPAPTAAATRVVTAAPTTPPPTAPPTAEPTAVATAAPAEPAVVKSMAPPTVRRGQRQLVDVRGEHLRADLQARFQHKGRAAAGVEVARQKAADPGLLQMLLVIGPDTPTGSYSLSFVDAQGRASNAVLFEVVQ